MPRYAFGSKQFILISLSQLMDILALEQQGADHTVRHNDFKMVLALTPALRRCRVL